MDYELIEKIILKNQKKKKKNRNAACEHENHQREMKF